MKIVIVGWGSLIWDPRDLPLERTWQNGGPNLPIEFSQVSQDCRLTLVIDYENGVVVPTQLIHSPRVNLGEAIKDLRLREGTIRKRIGFVDLRHGKDSTVNYSDAERDSKDYLDRQRACSDVSTWLSGTDYNAAVRTALTSNFKSEVDHDYSVDAALEYLWSLPKSAMERAIKYISNAPAFINTPLLRRLIEIQFIKDR